MAITSFETVYVIDLINVETKMVTTITNAYVSLENANAFVEMCIRMDEKEGISKCWEYRVRPFTLFR